MPFLKFALRHKPLFATAIVIMIIVGEIVVRPAYHVGFRNYPDLVKIIMNTNARNDIDGDQKAAIKAKAAMTYINRKK